MLFPIFVRQGRSRGRYKAGYIDRDGNVVVEPAYDYAHPFREGLASVRLGNKWGAVDLLGQLVIPVRSERSLDFNEGLAEFHQKQKSGAIDRNGDVVIATKFDQISHFAGGIACVRSGKLYGFIDRNSDVVMPPVYEDARTFSEELAAVKVGGVWGYIRTDGTTAIAPRFVCKGGIAGWFRNGLARVAKDVKWGHINADSEFVTPPIYDMALEFSEGLAEVRIEKLTGFVNVSGELVVPTIYQHANRFSEGMAAVKLPRNNPIKSFADSLTTGFIDKQGNTIIRPQFLGASSFRSGRCLVESEKHLGYIGIDGNFVWKTKFIDIGMMDPHHILPATTLGVPPSAIN